MEKIMVSIIVAFYLSLALLFIFWSIAYLFQNLKKIINRKSFRRKLAIMQKWCEIEIEKRKLNNGE